MSGGTTGSRWTRCARSTNRWACATRRPMCRAATSFSEPTSATWPHWPSGSKTRSNAASAFAPAVILRTTSELRDAMARNPFGKAERYRAQQAIGQLSRQRSRRRNPRQSSQPQDRARRIADGRSRTLHLFPQRHGAPEDVVGSA